MNKIGLKLYVADKCPSCRRVETQLLNFIKKIDNINLEVVNITEKSSDNFSIVPALFVEKKLFGYGEIDLYKLKLTVTN